jgi:haloalkane dehalogenase
MIFEENFFVETVLPTSIVRRLSDEEFAMYRKPFVTRDARKPTLEWPRELPIEGEPSDVVEIVERYAKWLARSTVPKLFINAEPGALITGRAREFCRAWPNQREVTVKGIHYVQEDSPSEIGVALRTFIKELRGDHQSKADGTDRG